MTKNTTKRLVELRDQLRKIEKRGLYPGRALYQEIARLEARVQISARPILGEKAQG